MRNYIYLKLIKIEVIKKSGGICYIIESNLKVCNYKLQMNRSTKLKKRS